MFEVQIKNENERLHGLINDVSRATYQNLINSFTSDSFYEKFIRSDALYQCYRIMAVISAEGIFPDNLYNDDGAFDSFYDFQLKYASPDKQYLNDLLQNAIDLRFNFTIRPVTTLITYIFSDSVSIPVNEARLKLNYFSGNRIVLDIAEYILDNPDNFSSDILITKAKFSIELHRILKNYIGKSEISELFHIADDLFDLLNVNELGNLLILSLIIFFDDIKLPGVVEKLDSEKDNFSNFTRSDLSVLLNQIMSDEDDLDKITDSDIDNTNQQTV